MPLFLLACASPPDTDTDGDTDADTDTDADSDTDADTDTACTSGLTGSVPDGGWSGDGIGLRLSAEDSAWSDGCYGGRIDGPLTAERGVFDWSARIYASAGGPEPRDMRAVGCVTNTTLELSIIEVTGAAFWGPWHLTPDPAVEVQLCD